MFLSFIVPVYNTEKYLGECLDSLLAQDIPYDDYEIICVNDGSTDGSLKLLREYEQAYPNVTVIDQANGGVSTARNAGLDIAKGEYIWFIDSDDLIRDNVLAILRNIIQQEPCDRLTIGSYVFEEQLSENEIAEIKTNKRKVNSHYYDSIVWGSIFSNAFLRRNNCKFHYPEITHGEDSLFMYEFASHSPVCSVYDEPVYFYRIRSGSAQTSQSKETKVRQLYSYLRVTEILQQHYITSQKTTYDANMLMTYLWYTLFCSISASAASRHEVMKKLSALGLFPYSRPNECSLRKSYSTTRTDFVGKLFDYFYINMHRPWGFCAMYVLQRMITLKHRMKRMVGGKRT